MKIEKEIITSIKPSGRFDASRLINNTNKMNERIEKTIQKNEEKIEKGRQRVLKKSFGKIL